MKNRSINGAINDDIERIDHCKKQIKNIHTKKRSIEYDIEDQTPASLLSLLLENKELLNNSYFSEDVLLTINKPLTPKEVKEEVKHNELIISSAINHIKGYINRTENDIIIDDLMYFLNKADIKI